MPPGDSVIARLDYNIYNSFTTNYLSSSTLARVGGCEISVKKALIRKMYSSTLLALPGGGWVLHFQKKRLITDSRFIRNILELTVLLQHMFASLMQQQV